jgi:hypothetical protein
MSDKSGFRFVMAVAFLATAGLVAGCVDDEARTTTTERTTTTVTPQPAFAAPAPGTTSTTTTTTKQTYP